MPDFVYNWPLWVTGLLMSIVLVGFATVAIVVSRRCYGPQGGHHRDGEFIATMVHSMMVVYALVAALIAVGVWEKHAEIASVVTHETSALSTLYRDATGYPEPVRSQLMGAIRDYTEQIVQEAWPQQRRGIIPTGGVAKVDRIQTVLLSYEPATEGQKLLHGETLDAYNTMVDVRRQRVDANHEHLPGILWMVDIVGAALCLVGASLFRVEKGGTHVLATGLLAVLIGTILLMTLALERPYRGDLGIRAEAYQLMHDQLMSAERTSEHSR